MEEKLMEIGKLSPNEGARTKKVRVGRGLGSGIGKTSGKGQKGQNSRSGGGVRPGFEGNQMPLTRILPKRGFHNYNRKEYAICNICDLQKLEWVENLGVVDADLLRAYGIIGKIEKNGLKVLSNGEINFPISIRVNKISASAKEKIEKAGGKVEVL